MLREVRPYAGFLKFAGGVTFSGGEPMMQAGFIGNVMGHIKKEMGLHIALDTQGYLHTGVEDEWFDNVDLVMLDIKHIDPEKYHAITAQHLQPTLDFAERLKRLKQRMWMRYVLVPGLTDDADDVNRMADYVASLGDIVERVEVLPFHQMGIAKWDAMGKEYTLRDTPTPTTDETEAARDIFRARGLYTV